MIVGLIGRTIDPAGRMCSAGAGKDEVARILVKAGFIQLPIIAHVKQFVQNIFPCFTDEHLWGPSEKRNEVVTLPDGTEISARLACIELGKTVRRLHRTALIDNVLRKPVVNSRDIVISDIRYPEECETIRKRADALLVAVVRHVDYALPKFSVDETETSLESAVADTVLFNNGSLSDLKKHTEKMLATHPRLRKGYN